MKDRDQHSQKEKKEMGGTEERRKPRINILRDMKEDNLKNREQELLETKVIVEILKPDRRVGS